MLSAPAREQNVGRLKKAKRITYAAAARKTTKRLTLLILILLQ